MCSTGDRAVQQRAPSALEDGRRPQPQSGTHSGWLSKAKGDGARAKWLAAAGWRYFTIDFDNHVLFYSHSESSKQVSVPTPFTDILGASMSVESEPGGKTAPAVRRSLSGSLLGNAPAAAARSATCFALHTVDRRVRLEARTEFEARDWVEQLNRAKMLGQYPKDQCPRPSERPGAAAAGDRRPCPSESSGASRSTSASGSSRGSAPSGRTTPTSEAGCPDAVGRCMAGAAGAGGMDAVQELQRVLQEELDAKAARDLAERRRRGLQAADFGLEEDAVGDEPGGCDGSPSSSPQASPQAADFSLGEEAAGPPRDELGGGDESLSSSPVPNAGAEASDDGSDEEGDPQSRGLRAQSDMLLAAPARTGVAGRRRSRRRERHDGRAERAGGSCAAVGLDTGDAEAATRVAADMRLAGLGGSVGALGPASAQCAARRAERIAADLSNGDADSAARIAADLMLVERLKGMGGVGR